ncbi:MAG TPA: SurA N-terminal domain-containing protein [Oligoflexia bacterium]|nr:SurA N-terminal domain-containing protein [Oligoflexia bacterium]HMR24812.1 SurA N-terminal domain-containing protein [Oligoflexia bacterium]
MLQSISEGMVSPFAKVLLFILAAAMIGFYGFSGSCGGAMSENIIATVDGKEISQNELARAFQEMIAYQQSQGMNFNNLPPEMITMFQKQVLQSMIQKNLLLKQAKALGMVMPKKAVQKNIYDQFTQGNQTFDFQQYKNILARFGQTPAQFEKEEGEKIMVNSLYQAMNAIAKTPLHLLKADYAINNTKAKVSYIKLNANQVQNKLGVEHPTQEQLKEYFEQNKENYRVPEQRDFSLYWLNLATFLPQPNDEDLNQTLKSAYNAQQKEKLTQARYHARHILIAGDNEASRAQKIYQRIKSGESFNKIALMESEDPGSKGNGGDLGYFSSDSMVPEFQNAVESLRVGQVSTPVKTSFGYHIIELLDKIQAGPVNVTRLKKELAYTWQARALEQDNYKNIALDAAKKVFANQAKKQTYNNINQNDDLPQVPDSNDTSIIMGKVMGASLKQKSDVFTAASSNYLYQVELHKIEESRIPSYDSISQTVKTNYLDQAYQKAFSTLMAQKNQQLLKGEITNLQSLANELGQSIQTTGWFSANDSSQLKGQLDIEDLKPALSMQKDSLFKKTIVQGKDYYFLAVADLQTPNWSQFDIDSSTQNNSELINTQKITQWIKSLEENANIEIAPQFQDS